MRVTLADGPRNGDQRWHPRESGILSYLVVVVLTR